MITQYTRVEHRQWVEALMETRKTLTKWEHDFVHSIDEQLDAGKNLSPRREEILERIYSEKT